MSTYFTVTSLIGGVDANAISVSFEKQSAGFGSEISFTINDFQKYLIHIKVGVDTDANMDVNYPDLAAAINSNADLTNLIVASGIGSSYHGDVSQYLSGGGEGNDLGQYYGLIGTIKTNTKVYEA